MALGWWVLLWVLAFLPVAVQGHSGRAQLRRLAHVTAEFDPFVGVRVGEALFPGPIGHSSCLDEQWEADDEGWEESLFEDMPDCPSMDPCKRDR